MRPVARWRRALLPRVRPLMMWWLALAFAYLCWISTVTVPEAIIAAVLAAGGVAVALASKLSDGYRPSWSWRTWLLTLAMSVACDTVYLLVWWRRNELGDRWGEPATGHDPSGLPRRSDG